MSRSSSAALVAVALLIALAFLARPRTPAPPPRQAATPAPPSSAARPSPLPVPAPAPASRDALVRHLAALGRALLLRDGRTRESLALPRLAESDVPWLIEQLRGELFTALGALDLLRRLDRSEAAPAIGDLLRAPVSVFLKDAAADALGALGGSVAQAALHDALVADLDGSVRARVALALARFDGPEVYAALARALRTDRDPAVRRAAADALARLPSQEAVRIFLEQLAAEPDGGVQLEILASALRTGGEALLPRLREEVRASPALRAALEEEIKRRGAHRYAYAFPRGGGALPWGGRRIGVTVESGAIPLADVAAALFSAPPLDRYAALFHLRRADELAADVATGVPAPRCYDARGVPIPSGAPLGGLDGAVFVHFRDPKSFAAGVLGYTEGRDAYVTAVSLLHEVGHALAQLGDEYGTPGASKHEAANVDAAGRAPKWQPLVDRGIVGAAVPRGDAFVVPSGDCHMGNRTTDGRFCPVCELELIARICELTGAPLPW